jgi:hypothetical protein
MPPACHPGGSVKPPRRGAGVATAPFAERSPRRTEPFSSPLGPAIRKHGGLTSRARASTLPFERTIDRAQRSECGLKAPVAAPSAIAGSSWTGRLWPDPPVRRELSVYTRVRPDPVTAAFVAAIRHGTLATPPHILERLGPPLRRNEGVRGSNPRVGSPPARGLAAKPITTSASRARPFRPCRTSPSPAARTSCRP